MKSKSSNLAFLRQAVINALVAIGLKTTEINFLNSRIEIPSCGVVVKLILEEGARVWKAESTYSMMRLDDAFESKITTQLFTVPLEDELLLARRLAVYISTSRIDVALDATFAENSGRMQSHG